MSDTESVKNNFLCEFRKIRAELGNSRQRPEMTLIHIFEQDYKIGTWPQSSPFLIVSI